MDEMTRKHINPSCASVSYLCVCSGEADVLCVVSETPAVCELVPTDSSQSTGARDIIAANLAKRQELNGEKNLDPANSPHIKT